MNKAKKSGSNHQRVIKILICIIVILFFTVIYQFFAKNATNVQPVPPSDLQSGSVFSSFSTPDTSASPVARKRGKPAKIAYIFAGSARSFVCPKVHWSLRFNVIDAFGGDPYAFVHISTEDNRNTRTGKGVIWNPTYVQTEVEEALKILNPITVEYFTLTHQEEEMQRDHPSEIHRVFRENDLRRYSMFYHRSRGYKLVLDYEQKHGFKFDWVVLIRLDAGWSSPVYPIEHYANDRVWITETGYVAYNDQFMLVPRQFSDYMFSLDTKVTKDVYCLGGPDVEVSWKCNATRLASLGQSPEKINTTLTYCCSDVFTKNMLGYSETIHYRHFLFGRIPIGMARFAVYLTRYDGTCRPDCDRLMYNFKNYAFALLQRIYPYFKNMNPIDTRATTISLTDVARCYVVNHASSLWNPPTAAAYHKQIAKAQDSSQKVDYSRNFYDQLDRFRPSMAFFHGQFAAWFIHPTQNVEGCLTFVAPNSLDWLPCKYHVRRKGGFRHFPSQSFFLHVNPHEPPYNSKTIDTDKIVSDNPFYKTYGVIGNPTSVRPPSSTPGLSAESSGWRYYHGQNMTRIMMPERHDQHYLLNGKVTCLTADFPAKKIILAPCSRTYNENPHQWFYTIQGETTGSHALSTVGMIRLVKQPSYCIARGFEIEKDDVTFVNSGYISIRGCQDEGPQTMYFEFEYLLS